MMIYPVKILKPDGRLVRVVSEKALIEKYQQKYKTDRRRKRPALPQRRSTDQPELD